MAAAEPKARTVMLPPPLTKEGEQDCSAIAEGDLVIVFESMSKMKAVYVTSGKAYDSTLGRFSMSNWIGRPFGSKILYAPDISLVTAFLDLVPGSVVLESGTGSASLTHSLVRAVAPTGHVHTFEFHKQRSVRARDELKRHGLSDMVTVEHRDVEANGFPERFHGEVNAVFLDLPHPWIVVHSASQCLVDDGVLCSFSPCIEQVQRTCETLTELGFEEIRTFECLQRIYDVCRERRAIDLEAVTGAAESPWAAEGRGKEGEDATEKENGGEGPGNGKGEGGEGGEAGEGAGKAGGEVGAGEGGGKGQKRGRDSHGAGAGGNKKNKKDMGPPIPEEAYEKRVICKPQVDAKGHTGYLTFARKPVVPVVVVETAPGTLVKRSREEGGSEGEGDE